MVWAWLLVVGSACLASACQNPQVTNAEERVYAVTFDAWHAEPTLPAVEFDGLKCEHLDEFKMWLAPSLESYESLCPVKSWACVHYAVIRGARNRQRPVAVLSPLLDPERWDSNGAHELCHILSMCAGNGWDPGHTDTRIWKGRNNAPNINSVEYQAVRALYLEE